ncbi:type II toxin-antitoxin system VapC family toxin [Nostoc sp.]|uniref:type II toxin-antitoxin system VapC family toxin n=1 Tax=Nostoc sp. TaxID=1180 RepID=UPI002FF4975D
MRSLGFDQYAINCYEDLIRQRIRIGTQDLRIAAITLSVNGILVTRNRKDFEKVPNLRFEDWTIS